MINYPKAIPGFLSAKEIEDIKRSIFDLHSQWRSGKGEQKKCY